MTPTVRSSLARWQGREPADDDALRALAGAAWRDRGWACFHLDSITNEWLRMGVEAEMIARHGKRRAGA